MSNKAQKLAEAITAIETNITLVEQLAQEALAEGDFNFVDDFRDKRGGNLQETGVLMAAFAKRMAGHLNTLGNVLYVREMESTKPPSDWRMHADNGKKVDAIKSLREWTGSEFLSLSEAVSVVDAYIQKPF